MLGQHAYFQTREHRRGQGITLRTLIGEVSDPGLTTLTRLTRPIDRTSFLIRSSSATTSLSRPLSLQIRETSCSALDKSSSARSFTRIAESMEPSLFSNCSRVRCAFLASASSESKRVNTLSNSRRALSNRSSIGSSMDPTRGGGPTGGGVGVREETGEAVELPEATLCGGVG